MFLKEIRSLNNVSARRVNGTQSYYLTQEELYKEKEKRDLDA